MAKNLLVTGATGKQGGALISALLASKSAAEFAIYAVTRNPSSAAAQSLASKPNVKVIKGDLNDPEALFKEEGVKFWGVYSVQAVMGQGQSPVTEEKQGIQLIDAAISHGHVKQFVYTSADRGGPKSSSTPTNVPHFISKYHVEKHLVEKAKGSSMGYTIFRPVAFLENLTNDFAGKGFTASWRVSTQEPLQVISTQDVGWFAAQAFINPTSREYANAALTLAGDSLTYTQAAQVFRETTGQVMPTTYDIMARAFLWGMKDMGLMFKWFGTDGFGADVPALRKMHPDMLTFGDWLQKKSAWRK